MANKYRIMQETETGEEFCVDDNLTIDQALGWIDENIENFPESSFFIYNMKTEELYTQGELNELDFDA